MKSIIKANQFKLQYQNDVTHLLSLSVPLTRQTDDSENLNSPFFLLFYDNNSIFDFKEHSEHFFLKMYLTGVLKGVSNQAAYSIPFLLIHLLKTVNTKLVVCIVK